jgi:hypothetical protein
MEDHMDPEVSGKISVLAEFQRGASTVGVVMSKLIK